MKKSRKLKRSILSGVVAVAMVGSLSFAPALASAQQEYVAGSVSDVPEWAIDDGENADSGITTQAALPSAYDLRDEGLVTPVKFQNPWGSCWAFGGTSAAEISILSASGQTYDEFPIDLSERHLTYFALQPVTESVDEKQAGEGLHTYEPTALDLEANPYAAEDAAFNAGGLPAYLTTVFAQGVGPVPEGAFPYRGESGTTTYDDYTANKDHILTDIIEGLAEGEGMTYDQFMGILNERATQEGKAAEEVLAELLAAQGRDLNALIEAQYQSSVDTGSYTKYDNWGIPETNDEGHPNRLLSSGYVLKNGNVLPEYWDADKTERQVEGYTAIKQELLNGHGVNIAFFADTSGTYAKSDEGQRNLYNQYVDQYMRANHGVCIVGWDDSYSKTNFNIEAPGDGAWIVKNSWGSTKYAEEDDLGNVMGKRNYGFIEGGEYTGCFYLSYYDKTISQAETMEFSQNLGSGGGFHTIQHDYQPASQGFYTTDPTEDVMSSANVFDSGEGVVVKSVSTRTAETNMRVTFAIYELKDNFKDPTDGDLLYRTSQNFEYGGFHRLDLDQPITFDKNKKFSVVSTASVVDPSGDKRLYSTSANRGLAKTLADALRAKGNNQKVYSEAVINEGESYLYQNGEWQDWGDYVAAQPADPDPELKDLLPDAQHYTDTWTVDNFSIKVYADPKGADTYEANPMTVKANQVTAKAKKKTTIAADKAFTVTDAKGEVSFYKESGNAKITVAKVGKVTVKKGLKKGKTYKAKVLVTAAGDEKYAPASKTVTLKVKIK